MGILQWFCSRDKIIQAPLMGIEVGIEFQQNDLMFKYYLSAGIALSSKYCNP
jgi:hypothetical protein